MPIYANHAHVLPEEINPNGTVKRLLKMMDECGIEGAVCFAPFAHAFQSIDQDPNEWLANIVGGNDRLRGFGTIDFKAGQLTRQVQRLVDLGMSGLKLHPNVQEFDILEPLAMEVYAAAQQQDLFVSFHTGVHAYRLKHTSLCKFDEVAHHFPKLRFSMEHMGGYHFFNEALAVLFNRYPPPWIKDKTCNVYAGLASIFTEHQNRMWHLKPDQILEIILQTSATQCIFGLDFPYNQSRETQMGIQTIGSLPITPAEKDLILGGNLKRLLNW